MPEPAAPPPAAPTGEVVIRTLAMPADTNANGDIFGGWLLSQMDLGGAVLARSTARSRVVTVAIDSMSFLRAVNVGDLVTCYAKLLGVGRTSMRVHVEAWARRFHTHEREKVTDAHFTFVAIDESGRPRAVPGER